MCDLCAVVRGPRPLVVAPDDGSPWAHTYRVIAEGPEASAAHGRAYLERNGLVERVEALHREGVGLRREPRADGEDEEDGDHG